VIRNGPSAKGVMEDPVIQEPGPKPEDSQSVEEGTGRPRGGGRSAQCDWWGCTDNGVSTPVRTNPGRPTNEGSTTVRSGHRTGPGAVTDPTPMDDTTGSTGGGFNKSVTSPAALNSALVSASSGNCGAVLLRRKAFCRPVSGAALPCDALLRCFGRVALAGATRYELAHSPCINWNFVPLRVANAFACRTERCDLQN
jgi:hypothetical protein